MTLNKFDLHYCAAAKKHEKIPNPDTRTESEKKHGIEHLWVINDEQCIDILIKNKVNVNALDSHGTSAIALATSLGKQSIIVKLLNAGADPNLTSGSLTAYEMADDKEKSFFIAKGFAPTNKAQLIDEATEIRVNELGNNAVAIINPQGDLQPIAAFANLCRWMGQLLKDVQAIEGQSNVANFKMSLLDNGRSYKEMLIEDFNDVMQEMIGPELFNYLELSGANSDYCYNIMISV